MDKEILQCVGYVWEDYDTDGVLIGKYFYEEKPENVFMKELRDNIKPIYIRKGMNEKSNTS